MIILGINICIFILVLYLGIKLGGLGIAYSSGIGLFVYTLIIGIPPGNIPITIVCIIICIIGAVSVLELAGGLSYMAYIAEKLLHKHPRYLNILAPIFSFFLTVMVGTGLSSYALMPIIVDVAKKNNLKPVHALTTSVIAAQLGVTASPITAAAVVFASLMLPLGVSLHKILLITFPACFLSILIVGILQSCRSQYLNPSKEYFSKLSKSIPNKDSSRINASTFPKGAYLSIFLFMACIVLIIFYVSFPIFKPTYADGNKIENAHLIMLAMLSISFIIIKVSKVNLKELPNQSTFKSGFVAVLSIISVAWLGNTLISYYQSDINLLIANLLSNYAWLLPLITFVISGFLYSQATTVLLIMPLAIGAGISPEIIITSFIAVNSLFILPTYPTLIAAQQMDDTGSTKFGKYIFNHSFIIPGILMIFIAVFIASLISSLVF